jgi:hypothetical protein
MAFTEVSMFSLSLHSWRLKVIFASQRSTEKGSTLEEPGEVVNALDCRVGFTLLASTDF